MAKAVAKKAEKGGLPAEFEAELLEDAGEFEEHLQQADMAIPFLQVIQAQSPQVTEGDAQFIKEAVKGMLFNTVTKKCYDGREEGVMIVPIKYKRSFIEWVRREDGGGFVAEHPPEESGNLHTKLNEDRQDIIQEGSRYPEPFLDPNGERNVVIIEKIEPFSTYKFTISEQKFDAGGAEDRQIPAHQSCPFGRVAGAGLVQHHRHMGRAVGLVQLVGQLGRGIERGRLHGDIVLAEGHGRALAIDRAGGGIDEMLETWRMAAGLHHRQMARQVGALIGEGVVD